LRISFTQALPSGTTVAILSVRAGADAGSARTTPAIRRSRKRFEGMRVSTV